jgi:hypothetical protein
MSRFVERQVFTDARVFAALHLDGAQVADIHCTLTGSVPTPFVITGTFICRAAIDVQPERWYELTPAESSRLPPFAVKIAHVGGDQSLNQYIILEAANVDVLRIR